MWFCDDIKWITVLHFFFLVCVVRSRLYCDGIAHWCEFCIEFRHFRRYFFSLPLIHPPFQILTQLWVNKKIFSSDCSMEWKIPNLYTRKNIRMTAYDSYFFSRNLMTTQYIFFDLKCSTNLYGGLVCVPIHWNHRLVDKFWI